MKLLSCCVALASVEGKKRDSNSVALFLSPCYACCSHVHLVSSILSKYLHALFSLLHSFILSFIHSSLPPPARLPASQPASQPSVISSVFSPSFSFCFLSLINLSFQKELLRLAPSRKGSKEFLADFITRSTLWVIDTETVPALLAAIVCFQLKKERLQTKCKKGHK